MRALTKIASLALATGMALSIGLTGSSAASAATLKPMTPEQAHAMGWHLLVPAIEGKCTRYFLTSNKRVLISERSKTPNDQCPANDYGSSLQPLATMAVSNIVRNDGGAPGLSGLMLMPNTYTTKIWRSAVQRTLQPSSSTLKEIMSVSKRYLRK